MSFLFATQNQTNTSQNSKEDGSEDLKLDRAYPDERYQSQDGESKNLIEHYRALTLL